MTREILITEAGFYPAITSRQYFAEPCPQPALTASGIKTLLGKTPAEFAYGHPAITPDSPEAASTAAKRFGDVAHQLALGKGRGYAVGDYDAWLSKDAKTFKKDAEDAQLTPIKRKDFEVAQLTAHIMRERIKTTFDALAVKPDYETEMVIAWKEETRHGPIWCRAMLDVWAISGFILDPKFSNRLMDGVFEQHAVKMGWDLQGEWYRRGVEKLKPELAGRSRFINLIVDPKPPHLSRAREANEPTAYSARTEIERSIDMFAACLHGRSWPGYPIEVEPWTARNWTLTERAARFNDEDSE